MNKTDRLGYHVGTTQNIPSYDSIGNRSGLQKQYKNYCIFCVSMRVYLCFCVFKKSVFCSLVLCSLIHGRNRDVIVGLKRRRSDREGSRASVPSTGNREALSKVIKDLRKVKFGVSMYEVGSDSFEKEIEVHKVVALEP
ncbi:hypothetical protein PanWU01x14_039540 [Parasponia andersonii]|uniref:Uncharacterized protein n=1 Tax=Parasponia andersonii TaxID=3476 RepID=A0A2P5DQX6_PARAD|nr:hypothetical protein PanWU01x14_039540 [Parasponia andersonii]